MKTIHPTPSKNRQRGSALITVVLIMAMMALLTASLLNYTMTEKRGNNRNILQLRAKNMAENISLYAAEQLTTRLLHSKPTAAQAYTGASALQLPDSSGNNNVLGTVKYAVPGSMEVSAGVEALSTLAAVTDTADNNYGLYVQTATLPIIAKSTVTHSVNGTFSAYVLQEMKITMAPLFQFGMFYNMDMELYPSQAFTVAGPVHTNGNLIAHPDGSSNVDIRFADRVTAYEGVYWNTAMKAKPRTGAGAENLPTEANGNIFFTHTNGTTTANLKGTGTLAGKWKDHKFGTTTENDTTKLAFKSNATTDYNGNLRSSAHNVKRLDLPGVSGYKETDNSGTSEDERNNGRQIIEPPQAKKWKNSTSAFTTVTDDSEAQDTKISWRAGLYIMVNPDDDAIPRSGTLPNNTTAYVLPRSYRAWLNTINTSTGVHTITEVILPGQPSYGYGAGADATLGTADDIMYHNYLPNRYVTNTIGGVGTANQVLRIPQAGYGLARSYKINLAAGYAINATDLVVDTGTGRFQQGDVVTIGNYRYLVYSHDMSTNTVKLMPPGLRAAVVDNEDVVNYTGVGLVGTSQNTSAAATAAGGGTVMTFNTGTASATPIFYPGTVVSIGGSNRFLVTAAPTSAPAGNWFVGLGTNGSTVASGTAVATDATNSYTMGTGQDYMINGIHAINATSITLDTGSGSIWPGNALAVAATPYVVVASNNTGTGSFIIYPGLAAAAADDDLAIVDPYAWSGYSARTVFADRTVNNGAVYPSDDGGSGSYYCPPDAYFYDLRRANGNRGVISTSGTTALYNRFAVNYIPRPIAKIDFDLTRFKMMFNRVYSTATTSTIYDVRAPTTTVPNTVTFANSIYKASAAPAAYGLGRWDSTPSTFSMLPPATGGTKSAYTRQDPYRMYYAPANPATIFDSDPRGTTIQVPAAALRDGTAPDAWYDGIAIYLHSVDAEMRAQTSGAANRIDSGVRMWNGRGNVASIPVAAAAGFTFVTNDPLYVIGHFNADGTINSVVTSSTATGGYSARYPDDTSEDLCALMGDAFIALSAPIWDDATGGQTDGWNDALSGLPVGTPSASWRTGASSTSTLNGGNDGVLIDSTTGPKPGLLPNQSYPGTLGSARDTKYTAGVSSEISAALLMGLVPSNHDATQLSDNPPYAGANGVQSGGANNFPRLNDNWNGNGLYIRGSIVGLFESRVAMEPFTNSRNYGAPGRFWGLHQALRDSDHHIPLEPILIGCNRNSYRELTAAEYDAKKTAILALSP